MGWKPDPNSFVTDVMQQDWNKMFGFAFPSFSLIGWVISKVLWENVEAMILVTLTMQTKPWYTLLLRISIAFTSPTKPITKCPGRKTSSRENQVPKVSSMEITGKPWKWKEFQAMQPNLSPCPGDQVQLQVINLPGASGLAGVVDNKLIQFVLFINSV